jgi:hypothetical protein
MMLAWAMVATVKLTNWSATTYYQMVYRMSRRSVLGRAMPAIVPTKPIAAVARETMLAILKSSSFDFQELTISLTPGVAIS